MESRPRVHTTCKSNSVSVDSVSWSTTVSYPNLPSVNTRSFQTTYSRHMAGVDENTLPSNIGGARPKVDNKPTCTDVLHSNREPDRVSARVGSDCSSLAESQSGTITRSYQIREGRHLNFFTKSSLLKTIEKELSVHISIQKDQYCIDIKGLDKDVKLALNRIEDIGKFIFVNSTLIYNERAVNYLKNNSGTEYLASVERSCDVLLEREIKYSADETTLTKKVSDENIIWTCLGRKLILEKNKVDEVKASIKVIPVVKNKSGKVFSKNGNIVKMEIGWEQAPNLELLVTELLEKALEDNERAVALPLNPVGNWTFDAVMKGKKRQGQTKILLVKGQLDQTEADVLVNTTDPQLNFTSGKVSAALLEAAGPGLKQECRHKYSAGIKPNSLAVTAGHGLKCHQVFHITLPLYREDIESIMNVRNAMLLCLQEASANRYTSIAFPAIGTGALRYPSETVLSEMFGGVERFIQNCPYTSLRSIMFVIFPKDVDLFKKFERQHKKSTNEVQTTVWINIIGMQQNVLLAKKMIQSKEKELTKALHDTDSQVIPAVSSLDFQVLTKFFKKEFDSFVNDGVKISYNKSKNEIEICGTIAKNGVAFLALKSCLKKTQEMPKFELSINNLNVKLINDLNSREDVFIGRDDHATSVFAFAKSNDIIDQVKAVLQRQDESTATTMAKQMEKNDLSERDEEEMDTSDNELMFSQTEPAVKKTALAREFSWSKDSKNFDVYETGNLVIKVYKANSLLIPVEAIVNAPNKCLNHEGDSVVAGSKSAFRVCEAQIRHKGGLPPTPSVACTTDVHRFGKCEIYAFWPCWSAYPRHSKEGLDQYYDALKQTVINCFLTADDSQLGSIGLQINGSVPTDVCAAQYARAVIEFSNMSTTLREIHIVDDSTNNIDIVHKTFSAMIREGKQSPFPLSIYQQQSSSEHTDEAVETKVKYGNKGIKWTGRSKPEMNSDSSNPRQRITVPTYRSDKNILVCTFPPLHEVFIYDGDITRLENIKAVVCSESDKGEAKGKISKALLERGGKRYEQSKTVQFQKQRKMGEVITTEGGGNNYEWVIHAIASRSNEKLLPVIYKNIFQEANVRELPSVALPLLEAGEFGPVDSTKILFTELNRFLNERKGKGFTLHVVLNNSELSHVVKDVFKRCIDEMNGGPFVEKETMLQGDGDNVQQSNRPAVADDCVICMDKVTNPKVLRCGHVFCKDCIDGYFRVKKVCPTCGKVCGEITGDQPDGAMDIAKKQINLTGFEYCETITISYRFGDGHQGPDHPRPGMPFKGISRTAYLPDNQEGREVCAMLKVAFQRRLVFTIGTSRTTGKEGVITWNDIHHKTDPRPHTQFGYPDKTYLQRVRDELAVKGVTEQDIEKPFLKELEKRSFRQTFTTDNLVTYM